MTAWLRRYAAHDDPRVAAGNFVALVLASNQPFYPLYLWFILGAEALPATPDIAAGLVFFAIPALARRHPTLARAVLPVAGMLNTVIWIRLLGEASGVGLFLFPCAMLAAMLFDWRDRWLMLGLTGLPLIVYLATAGRLGPPILMANAAQTASLLTLNSVSAFSLMAFLAWVQAGMRREG